MCPAYNPSDRRTLSTTLIDKEVARITISVEKELRNEENLSLVLDSWKSNQHKSYCGFLIVTSSRKQFVHSIKDFSNYSQTGTFFAEEITKILEEVGPHRFSAVVSDGASYMQLAKRLITEQYPHILSIRCVM